MKLPDIYPVEGGFACVVSAGTDDKKRRIQFRLRLATGTDDKLARARLADILRLRRALVKAGRGPEAQYLMTRAGEVAGDERAFTEALSVAAMVEALPRPQAGARWRTWGELAHAWADGTINREFPGKNIGEKDSERDLQRIEWLERFIGTVPLETFGEEHYNHAMANLPPRCNSITTARHYGQVIMRPMRIAKKCKLIESWHLDGVELPKAKKKDRPHFTCLFPSEVGLLLSPASPGELDYRWRLLWGFMVYESPRIGKLREVRWHHIETEGYGAISMESKSGDILYWDLRPGTLEALLHMRRLEPELSGPFAWLSEAQQHQAAKLLRSHLLLVGADRKTLHETEGRRRKLRAHDTRSTFVVFAKIEGRSESWIMDRTGHTTSEMIQRYDRLARVSAGKGWRPLGRLDAALGVEAAAEGVEAPAQVIEAAAAEGAAPGAAAGSELATVTATVTVESPREGGPLSGGGQVLENNLFDQRFRCLESNQDSGIQRPVGSYQTAQNTGVCDHRHALEAAGTDGPSQPSVTPAEVYRDALKAAARAALDADAWADLPQLQRLYEAACGAAESAAPVEESPTQVIAVAAFRKAKGGAAQ